MERSRTKNTAPIPPIAGLDRNLPLGDLLALGTQLRTDMTPEVLLQDVAEAIVRVLGFTRVYIRLRNSDTDALEACAFAGIGEEEIARIKASAVQPARYQALLQTSERLSESYLILDDDLPRAGSKRRRKAQILLVPLRSHGDRLIGAIYVDPSGIKDRDHSSVRVLEAIARQSALALENARLAARMQRLLAKEQLLAELGRDVSATLELSTILEFTGERLQRAFPGSAILLLARNGLPIIAAAVGDSGDPQFHMAAGQWVAEQRMPFLSNDLATEMRLTSFDSQSAIGSLIAVPLRSGGRVLGALSAVAALPNAFTYEDVDLLEAVAAQVGGPMSGAQLYQQTQLLAEQVRRRNDHLLVLNALARLAVSTLDIEQLLIAVTNQIHQGFGFSHVELFRIDETAVMAVLAARASRFVSGGLLYRQSLNDGILGRAYHTAKTVRVDNVRTDPDYITSAMNEFRSELCVPIVASGRVLALLNLESDQEATFTDEDVEAIETVADVMAGAMENARLYRRAQEVAVLEERSRLARDLHDSISQQLFSMTLTAQAARAQLEKNPARTATQLERIQETAAAALAEMRALIFQLRPPGLSEHGLIGALQQHVASLDRREGLDVTLSVDGDEHHARGVEQALYRIAQEALNNVVKHAGTCRVEVQLNLYSEQIALTICDNGKGFDPSVIQHGGRHLGLISMRERATELGGRLELHSTPGNGTQIIVTVPRFER
jgi:signal transduction histidine kinase